MDSFKIKVLHSNKVITVFPTIGTEAKHNAANVSTSITPANITTIKLASKK